MGMPVIDVKDRCEAVTDLIESVALGEAALAHILNAEGEKLQAIIAQKPCTIELLKVNDSVQKMVTAITRLEIIMQSKLELFADESCKRPRSEILPG